MQERFSLSSNFRIASDSRRRMMKPYLILRCISTRMKVVISVVQAEACGPLEMVVYSTWGEHRGTRVIRGALLQIVPEQSGGWVPQPLGKASQCLLLLTSEERQKVGCVEDFPGGGLSCSLQVACQWVDRQGVGCLCRRGVRQSLYNPRAEHYAVRPG